MPSYLMGGSSCFSVLQVGLPSQYLAGSIN